MARSGYGKHSAPDQAPRTAATFEHLPAREASIASHIDRLPDGAAMDIKTLAREIAAYGQQAVATALKALSEAGHLRRIRERLGDGGRTQWVQRTYFSRTPRSDAWWQRLLAGDVPGLDTDSPAPATAPPPHSSAYSALAALGRADARMTLSAAECAALEPLAAEWLARGVPAPQLVQALTSGLPDPVHCPGALARKRLTDKMPPEPVPAAAAPLRIMECTGCGIPGRPDALPGGLCRACRRAEPSSSVPEGNDVHARVERLRSLVVPPGARRSQARTSPRQGRGELRDQPRRTRR
ncbi:hypothetical protein [Streptomyces sp. NPDC001404]|uniref:hypothetical protein n=1 Tax=Streptomyces sp. NPDC001404 TaxID=3364571 RepID=UPI0036BE2CA5